MPYNDDDGSTHTKANPKADDNDEDKHQGPTVSKNSTHDDDETTQHLPPCDGSWLLALKNDASTDTNARPIPAPRHNHPTCAAPYMKAPTVQRRGIAQIL